MRPSPLVPFLLAVLIDAWLWRVPLATAEPLAIRVLPFLLAKLLDAETLAVVAVALHGAAALLVRSVVKAAVGDGAAALLAGCLFAVLPEPIAAVASRDVAVLLATCFSLGSILLGLGARPRAWGSASLYLLALACHPLAIPAPLLLALAWGRPPVLHVMALLASAVARSRAFPGVAIPDEPWVESVVAGVLDATGSAFSLPSWATAALLALAIAAAASPRTLPRRVRVWCCFFVVCALPWSVIALERSRPEAGALALSMLAFAALMAEVAMRIWQRRSE